jgi:IS5 family transposase
VVVKQIHERIVQIARDHRVAQGRRMRVDTTVVETNIHYPTDSSLLGDGVRVLTRMMKKITGIAGAAGTQLRDRSRSVKWRVLEIARAARAKGRQSGEKLAQAYRRLLEATGRVVGQAKRFATQIGDGVKRAADTRRQVVLEGAASGAGKHGAARAAGDAPDQCARLRRRHPRREQDCQPVRAVH